MSNLRNARLLSLLAFAMLLGCRGSASSARQHETSHLRTLVSLYAFAAAKLGHRPANEVEFKSFVAANGTKTLEALHISSVDDVIASERDGEPFVVLYGAAASSAHDVIAYERTGVDGKRLVGYSIGAVAEVDDQEFAALVPTATRAVK